MGTRSSITAKCTDGKYRSIYCHWDGYPSHNGRLLLEHYTEQAKIDALMELGDLSSLSESVEAPEGHSYSNPKPGCCVAYGRDRGESGTAARVGESARDARDGNRQAYNYLWEGARWTVNGEPLTKELCDG